MLIRVVGVDRQSRSQTRNVMPGHTQEIGTAFLARRAPIKGGEDISPSVPVAPQIRSPVNPPTLRACRVREKPRKPELRWESGIKN
jgi:hypothetical protein